MLWAIQGSVGWEFWRSQAGPGRELLRALSAGQGRVRLYSCPRRRKCLLKVLHNTRGTASYSRGSSCCSGGAPNTGMGMDGGSSLKTGKRGWMASVNR